MVNLKAHARYINPFFLYTILKRATVNCELNPYIYILNLSISIRDSNPVLSTYAEIILQHYKVLADIILQHYKVPRYCIHVTTKLTGRLLKQTATYSIGTYYNNPTQPILTLSLIHI